MKLAKITLTRGMFIPGLGERTTIENVEVDSAPATFTGGASLEGFVPAPGLLIVTPAAKVLIPWERVESVVTEWISLISLPSTKEIKEAIVAGAKQAAEIGGPRPVVVNGPMTLEEFGKPSGESLFAGGDMAARTLQPPPPQKKGGRR